MTPSSLQLLAFLPVLSHILNIWSTRLLTRKKAKASMYKPAAVHGKIHSVDSQSQGLGLTCNACVKMDNRLPQPSSQPFAAAQSATSQVSSSSHPPYHTQTAQPPVQMPFSDPFHTRDPFMPSSTQHSRRDSYGIGPGGASAAPGMGAPYERAWSTQPQGTTIESLSFT